MIVKGLSLRCRNSGELSLHALQADAGPRPGNVELTEPRNSHFCIPISPGLIAAGQKHILEQEDGKKRWIQVLTELFRAFALCPASDETTASYSAQLPMTLSTNSRKSTSCICRVFLQ